MTTVLPQNAITRQHFVFLIIRMLDGCTCKIDLYIHEQVHVIVMENHL